jgi:hypothetical protein
MDKIEKLEPRGLRNNNPLNIRHGQSKWQVTHPEKTDKDFVCYMSKAYGYRAGWKTLQTYYNQFVKEQKPFCVRTIIKRWAPPSDGNNTEGYIRQVVKLARIGGLQRLPSPDSENGYYYLHKVVMAMTCVENGIKPEEVDVDQILKGYQMAFPKTRIVINK